MTKREGVLCLLAAILLIVGGLTWAFGPWGMIGSGVALGVTILFVMDFDDREREA
jgi:protein-S-isoprenylcysteine O-methyltransferase Ste14